jgi:hypothetical protein
MNRICFPSLVLKHTVVTVDEQLLQFINSTNHHTMIRNILLSVLLLMSLSASSQNQSWVANGIDGHTYNIDSIVNSGKTVLVDISANWCQPCWDWHLTGIMEKIYREFGPDGTNDLEIIFVDGDQGSSMACLQGACLGSVGNWLTGTPYPIIGPYQQGHYVQLQYNMPAYPALFMHCPGSASGVTINREETFDEFLQSWQNACPAPFNNGSIDAMLMHNDDVESCAGTHPYTTLFNQGTDTLFAATLTLKQNGNLLDTKNWTGALPPFHHAKIYFDNYIYSAAGSFEKEAIVAGDAYTAGNIETDSFAPAPIAPNTLMTLDLQCDADASDTKWQLFDENDSVIASSPTANYIYNHFYTYNWVLNPNSCYTFALYDSIWGDGICCNTGQGYYRIRNTIDTLDNFIYGGQFKAFQEKRKFFTPSTTVLIPENADNGNLLIYPNPTSGMVNIQMKKETDAVVSVTDMLGEIVLNASVSRSSKLAVDLRALKDGLYWVRISTGSETVVRRITLSR